MGKNNKVQIVILAAGKGTRMNCVDFPKVLHPIGGKPMISHIFETVCKVCEKPTIVIGFQGEKVIEATGNKCHYVWQKEQLGTGHAVAQAKNDLQKMGCKAILVLYGDHPFVSENTIQGLINCVEKSDETVALAMSVLKVPNYEGIFRVFYNFGRILRNEKGDIVGIKEFKDANEQQRAITEVNLGYYCFVADWLWENIDELKNNNQSQEYYLTDLIEMAVKQKKKIPFITINDPIEGMGINTNEQLRIVEDYLKKRLESQKENIG